MNTTGIRTSTNNSTGNRYSSKTRRLANNSCMNRRCKTRRLITRIWANSSCWTDDPDRDHKICSSVATRESDEPCLGLGLNLVLFASATNVESGPWFDEVCMDPNYSSFQMVLKLELKKGPKKSINWTTGFYVQSEKVIKSFLNVFRIFIVWYSDPQCIDVTEPNFGESGYRLQIHSLVES